MTELFFDIKASDRVSQVVSSLSTQVASLEDSCQEVQQLKESVNKYKELLKTDSSGKAVNQGKLYSEVGERQKRRRVCLLYALAYSRHVKL